MKLYEIVLAFPGTITEEESTAKLTEITSLLGTHGAQAASLTSLGKHRLAYEINRVRFGWFATGTMELEPAAVVELEQVLKRHPSVIRLAIRTAKKDVKRSFSFVTTVHPDRNADRAAAHHGSTQYTPKPMEAAQPVDMAELDKKLDDIIAKGDSVPDTL